VRPSPARRLPRTRLPSARTSPRTRTRESRVSPRMISLRGSSARPWSAFIATARRRSARAPTRRGDSTAAPSSRSRPPSRRGRGVRRQRRPRAHRRGREGGSAGACRYRGHHRAPREGRRRLRTGNGFLHDRARLRRRRDGEKIRDGRNESPRSREARGDRRATRRGARVSSRLTLGARGVLKRVTPVPREGSRASRVAGRPRADGPGRRRIRSRVRRARRGRRVGRARRGVRGGGPARGRAADPRGQVRGAGHAGRAPGSGEGRSVHAAQHVPGHGPRRNRRRAGPRARRRKSFRKRRDGVFAVAFARRAVAADVRRRRRISMRLRIVSDRLRLLQTWRSSRSSSASATPDDARRGFLRRRADLGWLGGESPRDASDETSARPAYDPKRYVNRNHPTGHFVPRVPPPCGAWSA